MDYFRLEGDKVEKSQDEKVFISPDMNKIGKLEKCGDYNYNMPIYDRNPKSTTAVGLEKKKKTKKSLDKIAVLKAKSCKKNKLKKLGNI